MTGKVTALNYSGEIEEGYRKHCAIITRNYKVKNPLHERDPDVNLPELWCVSVLNRLKMVLITL